MSVNPTDEDPKPAPRGITDSEEARRAAEAQRSVEVEPQVDVMQRPPLPEPVYLGDGVYASFDGYQVWLAANHHENKVVALEYSVMVNLIRYARRVGLIE
jgi:hypothetical protein